MRNTIFWCSIWVKKLENSSYKRKVTHHSRVAYVYKTRPELMDPTRKPVDFLQIGLVSFNPVFEIGFLIG